MVDIGAKTDYDALDPDVGPVGSTHAETPDRLQAVRNVLASVVDIGAKTDYDACVDVRCFIDHNLSFGNHI